MAKLTNLVDTMDPSLLGPDGVDLNRLPPDVCSFWRTAVLKSISILCKDEYTWPISEYGFHRNLVIVRCGLCNLHVALTQYGYIPPEQEERINKRHKPASGFHKCTSITQTRSDELYARLMRWPRSMACFVASLLHAQNAPLKAGAPASTARGCLIPAYLWARTGLIEGAHTPGEGELYYLDKSGDTAENPLSPAEIMHVQCTFCTEYPALVDTWVHVCEPQDSPGWDLVYILCKSCVDIVAGTLYKDDPLGCMRCDTFAKFRKFVHRTGHEGWKLHTHVCIKGKWDRDAMMRTGHPPSSKRRVRLAYAISYMHRHQH